MMCLEKIRCQRGQMTVELCIVFPVVMVIALIAFNALTFFSNCATFDHAVRQSALTTLSSPVFSQDAIGGRITDDFVLGFERLVPEDMDISGTVSEVDGGNLLVSADLTYHPTLFGLSMRAELFGVSLPSLTHHLEFVVDRYDPGSVF